MRKFFLIILASLALVPFAQAHHSFAVHFTGDTLVEVQGTVKSFRFTNPHGVLIFTVMNENGTEVEWRAETNSPSMLRRRGWSADSLKQGDRISISGFPAREEEHYMRISHVEIEGGGELTAQAKAD